MRKHIFGIVLFIAIVSFSVFVYEYFSYEGEPDCGRAMSERCISTAGPQVIFEPSIGYAADDSDVSVKLENVVAGMRAGTVKARLRLTWVRVEAPPKAAIVQIQFHNFDGSTAGWISEPVTISRPFETWKTRTIEPVFECRSCHNLSRNLYATVRVWTKTDAEKKLLYEITEMRPVLVQE